MLNKIDTSKRIYIAPYNDLALEFSKYLKDGEDIEIDSFIDSFKKGENIIHPKDLNVDSNSIVFIISPEYYKEIYKNLSINLINSNLYIVSLSKTEYKIFRNINFFNFYLFLKKYDFIPNLKLEINRFFNMKKLKKLKNKHSNQRAFFNRKWT